MMRPELRQELSLRGSMVMTAKLRQAIELLPMTVAELEEYLIDQANENPLLEVQRARWELPMGLIVGRSSYGAANSSMPEDPKEELRTEIRLSTAPPAVQKAAAKLADSLDRRGLLPPIDEFFADELGCSLAVLRQGKWLLQSLGSPGFAAESWCESLRLQLAAKDLLTEVAEKVVVTYLGEAHMSLDQVAAKAGISKREVQTTLALLKCCTASPGGGYSPGQTVGVAYPDVYFLKTACGYQAQVNQPVIDENSMNRLYYQLLSEADSTTRQYLRERWQQGQWLARSVKQRHSTLQRIAEALITMQFAFLGHGRAFLRPLTMAEVAREVGVHESTVSRAVSHKFALTPQGLLPLKDFFSSHVQSLGGAVASQAVKERISQLISQEDKNAPLSDEDVKCLLTSEGISIGRRTVAKYREALHIPPRSQRRPGGRFSW